MARVVLLALILVSVGSSAAAAGGGPSPGTVFGGSGVESPDGRLRYVAIPAGGSTAVTAVSTRDGRIARFLNLRGSLGVPVVAFDGTTAGLSADGETLVLSTYAQASPGAVTRFAVLSTSPLRLRRLVQLPGAWSFDALSPDARLLYAIQYLGPNEVAGYRVRAVQLSTGRPLPGAIVDKREPDEDMRGAAITRATTRTGGWAYTLYRKLDGSAFVHALDTARRRAFCIDLPWHGVQRSIWSVSLALSADERTLALVQRGHRLALVDTASRRVQAFRRPVEP